MGEYSYFNGNIATINIFWKFCCDFFLLFSYSWLQLVNSLSNIKLFHVYPYIPRTWVLVSITHTSVLKILLIISTWLYFSSNIKPNFDLMITFQRNAWKTWKWLTNTTVIKSRIRSRKNKLYQRCSHTEELKIISKSKSCTGNLKDVLDCCPQYQSIHVTTNDTLLTFFPICKLGLGQNISLRKDRKCSSPGLSISFI